MLFVPTCARILKRPCNRSENSCSACCCINVCGFHDSAQNHTHPRHILSPSRKRFPILTLVEFEAVRCYCKSWMPTSCTIAFFASGRSGTHHQVEHFQLGHVLEKRHALLVDSVVAQVKHREVGALLQGSEHGFAREVVARGVERGQAGRQRRNTKHSVGVDVQRVQPRARLQARNLQSKLQPHLLNCYASEKRKRSRLCCSVRSTSIRLNQTLDGLVVANARAQQVRHLRVTVVQFHGPSGLRRQAPASLSATAVGPLSGSPGKTQQAARLVASWTNFRL